MNTSNKIIVGVLILCLAVFLSTLANQPSHADNGTNVKGNWDDLLVRDFGKIVNNQFALYRYTDTTNSTTCYIAVTGTESSDHIANATISCVK